jgi:hypothetical protein
VKGRTVNGAGYVLVVVGREHPMADSRGRVKEHRLVMAEHVGRPLSKREHVHHRDGDKRSNVLGNLVLFADAKSHAEFHRMLERGDKLRCYMAPVRLGPSFDVIRPSVARSLRASPPSTQPHELREAA